MNRSRITPLGRTTAVLLVLAFVVAACTPGSGPEGPSLASGGFVEVLDGIRLAASEDALDEPVALDVAKVEAPFAATPLPPGVQAVGEPFRLAGDRDAYAVGDALIVIGVPVPAGTPTDDLALAVLQPPDALDDGDGVTSEWVLLPGTFDAETETLAVGLGAILSEGRTMVLVRSADYDSVAPARARSPGIDPAVIVEFEEGFRVRCVGFSSGACTAADRSSTEAALDEAYAAWVEGLGYPEPRLVRRVTLDSWAPLRVLVGPYEYELRNFTRSECQNDQGQGVNGRGRYLRSSSVAYTCYDASQAAPAHRTTRHEFFHALQYGYPKHLELRSSISNFVAEGTARAAETSQVAFQRSPRSLRDIDAQLFTTGSAVTDDYLAQDFWVYLGLRFGMGLEYLQPILAAGATTATVDTVLTTHSGYPENLTLAEAYWDWARNQAFEKQVDIGGGVLGTTCEFQTAVASVIDVIADASGPAATPFNLTPSTTEVVRFEITNDAAIALDFALNVPRSSSELRIKFFDPADAGTSDCWGDPELSRTTISVPAGTTVERYALVANVDTLLSQAVVPSVTPQADLSIVLPDGPFQELDSLDFRADLVGVPDPSAIDIVWTVTDGDDATVPLDFGGTSTSGETVSSEVPCDDLLVRADATVPGVGAVFDVTAVSCLPPTQTFVFSADRARSGEVASTPAASNGSTLTDIRIGDDASDTSLHGLLHFGLQTLPESLVAIESATLTLGFEDPVGTPADLDSELVVVHVDYGSTLDADDYRGAAPFPDLFRSLYRIPFDETGFGSTQLDVTQAVQDAWAQRGTYGDHVQLMPYLAQGTDDDGVADHLVLNFEDAPGTTLTPSLAITFRNY
jgi:hypothetical protein